MAMTTHTSASDDAPIMDINTTPLIDVMLVLLVMLIITIPIQLHSVNLQLPTGTPPATDAKPEVVTIEIDDHSRVLWNGEPLADRSALQARLAAASAQAVQPELHVRPNVHAKYDTFAEVMVSANQAGLKKLGVLGHEQFIDR